MARGMKQKVYYFLYTADEYELPVYWTCNIEQMQHFLGASSKNSTYSLLSHYFNGDHDKIRGTNGEYYHAAKFKESELI